MIKIYRNDCSSYHRLVFQIKDFKICIRLIDWYKHKRRINRITKKDLSIIREAIMEYEINERKRKIQDKLDCNIRNYYYDNLTYLKNKLI